MWRSGGSGSDCFIPFLTLLGLWGLFKTLWADVLSDGVIQFGYCFGTGREARGRMIPTRRSKNWMDQEDRTFKEVLLNHSLRATRDIYESRIWHCITQNWNELN